MRGHIVVTLRHVDEQWIAVRHEPFEERLQIAAHVRVGVFLNQQRGRRVPQEQCQQAVLEFILFHPLLHFARELAKSAPARGDRQLVKGLTQHGKMDYWIIGLYGLMDE